MAADGRYEARAWHLAWEPLENRNGWFGMYPGTVDTRVWVLRELTT